MDPIKQIMDEHRVIERVIDVLEKIADGLEEAREIPPQLILSDIGMLIECTSEYHFEKEEEILISFLEETGRTDLKDAVKSYSDQFKAGEKYIDAILKNIDGYAEGDVKAAANIIKNIQEYVEHVRPLFEQEDETILKPLKQSLTDDELSRLEEEFKDFEESWPGPQVVKYQKIVRELERKSSLLVW